MRFADAEKVDEGGLDGGVFAVDFGAVGLAAPHVEAAAGLARSGAFDGEFKEGTFGGGADRFGFSRGRSVGRRVFFWEWAKGRNASGEDFIDVLRLEAGGMSDGDDDALLIDDDGGGDAADPVEVAQGGAGTFNADPGFNGGAFEEAADESFVLVGDGEELNTFWREFFGEVVPVGNRFDARAAPGGPEINDGDFAFEADEVSIGKDFRIDEAHFAKGWSFGADFNGTGGKTEGKVESEEKSSETDCVHRDRRQEWRFVGGVQVGEIGGKGAVPSPEQFDPKG